MLTRTPLPTTTDKLVDVRARLASYLETAKPGSVAAAERALTEARDEHAKLNAQRVAAYAAMRSPDDSDNRRVLADFDSRIAVADDVIVERRDRMRKLREPFRNAVAAEVAPIEAAADAALAEAVGIIEAVADLHRDIAVYRERNGITEPDHMPRPSRSWRHLLAFVQQVRR